MGTYVAPAPATRTSRILVGLIAVALVGALALGVALTNPGDQLPLPNDHFVAGTPSSESVRATAP